jgi:hypothetical protein
MGHDHHDAAACDGGDGYDQKEEDMHNQIGAKEEGIKAGRKAQRQKAGRTIIRFGVIFGVLPN